MFPISRIAILLFCASGVLRADVAPERHEWVVNAIKREALVYAPPTAKTKPTPLVFAFHGHGMPMDKTFTRYDFAARWPEAIVVCPQGLPTPGLLTDPDGKKPGWQRWEGDQGDRDLKFFDTLLASLRQEYRVDERRIYVLGHSNGGYFTYLLWATRGDQLAAVAPTGAASAKFQSQLKPLPAFVAAGRNDQLVKFEWQQATIQALRILNHCGAGEPWAADATIYPSSIGTPLVTYLHPRGHGFPSESAPMIIRFLKEQSKPHPFSK